MSTPTYSAATAPRPLHIIAREIIATWPRPNFGAVPYIQAMRGLVLVSGTYGEDTGAEIVQRFLINAGTWKGDDARRIKAELRALKR